MGKSKKNSKKPVNLVPKSNAIKEIKIEKADVALMKQLINESKANQEKFAEACATLSSAASTFEEQSKDLVNNMSMLMVRLDKIFAMFEDASKHVGDVETAEAKIANLSDKLESLLDQNKAIAQGLVLLEKYVRGKTRLEPEIQPKSFD